MRFLTFRIIKKFTITHIIAQKNTYWHTIIHWSLGSLLNIHGFVKPTTFEFAIISKTSYHRYVKKHRSGIIGISEEGSGATLSLILPIVHDLTLSRISSAMKYINEESNFTTQTFQCPDKNMTSDISILLSDSSEESLSQFSIFRFLFASLGIRIHHHHNDTAVKSIYRLSNSDVIVSTSNIFKKLMTHNQVFSKLYPRLRFLCLKTSLKSNLSEAIKEEFCGDTYNNFFHACNDAYTKNQSKFDNNFLQYTSVSTVTKIFVFNRMASSIFKVGTKYSRNE